MQGTIITYYNHPEGALDVVRAIEFAGGCVI
jgi:hypothetical protein